MVSCSAYGCKNRSEQGFLMKVFPKNPERRKRWAAKVQRANWTPNNNSYLCEVHFEPEMWEKTRVDGSRKLKYNAVPTIFKISEQKKEPPMEIEHIIIKCEVSYDDPVPFHVQDQITSSPDGSSKLEYNAVPTIFVKSEQEKEPGEIEHIIVKGEVSYDDPEPCNVQDQKIFSPESIVSLEGSAVSSVTSQEQCMRGRLDKKYDMVVKKERP